MLTVFLEFHVRPPNAFEPFKTLIASMYVVLLLLLNSFSFSAPHVQTFKTNWSIVAFPLKSKFDLSYESCVTKFTIAVNNLKSTFRGHVQSKLRKFYSQLKLTEVLKYKYTSFLFLVFFHNSLQLSGNLMFLFILVVFRRVSFSMPFHVMLTFWLTDWVAFRLDFMC